MQITKALIERYHLGSCTPEEQYAVEEWLENEEVEMSFPEHVDLAALENKGWLRFSKRFNLGSKKVIKLKFAIALRIAAALFLVSGIALYYFVAHFSAGNKEVTYQNISTANGEKLSCTLPDGTVVFLNSGSSIRFPLKFNAHTRDVRFRGEAFFKVAKDKTRPFTINTNHIAVRVLGTRFNLRAYPSERQTNVVVEEGKVSFSGLSSSEHLILTANQQGIYDGKSIYKEEVYVAKHLAWKNNQLLFDNQKLKEVAPVLERWYGVKVSIGDKDLEQERYTGRFDNPSLKEVLQSISFAIKLKYRKDKNQYIFY
ncbi:FecR domain-containing protein [Pedobacter sp. MC2016-14]|uniref:FecR family protein n=1 Tax=Pedobacter sp. MC2016-14 TaxID=2897327 RepID=UPI001E56725A|nr:FecR domain-containing protein [Pedobacter sp. MC2016-14]MCD0488519.1 FecR domain-containing protein [Pedobacter sp. MC2016-14]